MPGTKPGLWALSADRLLAVTRGVAAVCVWLAKGFFMAPGDNYDEMIDVSP